MKFLKIMGFLLLTYMFAKATYGQDIGTLTGIVIDKNTQTLLKDINVAVQGTDFVTRTREDGSFRITSIPYGTYSVEFTSVSYRKYIANDIIISPGASRELIIELLPVSTDEVIVQDFRFQKPEDISTSYKSLTFEEIRRFPGGLEDIGRVIQSLPGIQLTSDGRNDLLVRGGSPAENLFIVDGFEVNNFNHFGSQGSTGGPTSILNLDFAREIEFISGGFSAKYGDRLSSVVSVKQRNGNSEKFFGKVNLSGTGVGVNFEGPINKKNKSAWLVSARRSYLDLIFNAAGFSFVPEYTDFQLKINYTINSRNFLDFSSFGAVDNVKFNNDTEENKQNNERILTNNQRSYASGIIWRTLPARKTSLVTTLSRNYVKYFFSKRDSLFRETFRNSSRESDVQLKTELSVKLSDHALFNSGTGIKTILLDYDIDKKADTLLVLDSLGNRIIIPPVIIREIQRTFKYFLYSEITLKLMKRIRFTAGLRYDRFDYIEKKNYLSPRFSASVVINPKLNINLSYGIFSQSPSYIWLVAEGNNRLRNITAHHYIAGTEYFLDEATRITLEGYYKKYEYYPVSKTRPYLILANNSGFESQNSFGLEKLSSGGTGRAYGIELFIQKSLSNNLYGAFSLSLSDVKYTALDGILRRSDWDNRVVLNLNAGYKIGTKWEFSAKFRFAGGRPYTPINPSDGTINTALYNTETYPLYHRLDIRAERRWMFRKWNLITYIDIQNIYNRKNIFEYRWDPYKKQIQTARNLGILPTIGISAEF
jgi:hypothetical protein